MLEAGQLCRVHTALRPGVVASAQGSRLETSGCHLDGDPLASFRRPVQGRWLETCGRQACVGRKPARLEWEQMARSWASFAGLCQSSGVKRCFVGQEDRIGLLPRGVPGKSA